MPPQQQSRQQFGAQRGPGVPNVNIFVGNLPWTASPNDLESVFLNFGEIEDIKMPAGADGRPRGFAHVTMKRLEDAERAVAAIQEEPFFLHGRNTRVEFAQGVNAQPNRAEDNMPSNNLMLFEFDGDEVAVQEVFRKYSRSINRIHLVRDRETGASRRTVFVEFYNVEPAAEALEELSGKELPNGATLKMRFATPRKPMPRSG
ncbi:RNA-binding domain-containing protein [Exidia glandulosa HHB12029]|uniref:RNA-binding domain-containing protein n=1 Tax=Exidia glandulosa HHB12029 TaxID=1314781 RepID=A0A165BYJ4_EXIGL|nr:RNA-binding domain-containing protein [Exidia glandulosa HHB12029]